MPPRGDVETVHDGVELVTEQVSIPVERERGWGVAEHRLYALHAGAGRVRERCRRVT